jgi:CheY-like chemotaxis protein
LQEFPQEPVDRVREALMLDDGSTVRAFVRPRRAETKRSVVHSQSVRAASSLFAHSCMHLAFIALGFAALQTLHEMDVSLKVVIVDENPIRAAILHDGLREAGHVNVFRIDDRTGLLARIYAIDPDVILIDLENPSRDVLEQMFQVSRAVKRPVAMFVDQSVPRRPRQRSMPASRPTSSAIFKKSASRPSST